MKKLLVLLLLMPFVLPAQETELQDIPRNEIGLNLFSLGTRTEPFRYNMPYFSSAVASGISYKRSWDRNVLRTSATYSKELINYTTTGWEMTSQVHGTNATIGLSCGYERRYGHWKVTPYSFADITYSYVNSLGHQNGLGGDIIWQFDNDYHYVTQGIGLQAGSGVRWQINEHLFLGYELSCGFLYNTMREKKPGVDRYYPEWDFVANPVRAFSFGVTF
ncbi:MAG TPA: hypothetical protein VFU15_11295 [Bacteroidia bacterium]|nr:hypothetical protein [Bacteroidia bacterium]